MTTRANNQITAKKYATEMIRPYVESGEDVEMIAYGQLGVACTEYWGQIGGSALVGDDKTVKLGKYELSITKMNGKECLYKFDLRELSEEVRAGVNQEVLL